MNYGIPEFCYVLQLPCGGVQRVVYDDMAGAITLAEELGSFAISCFNAEGVWCRTWTRNPEYPDDWDLTCPDDETEEIEVEGGFHCEVDFGTGDGDNIIGFPIQKRKNG